MNNTNFIHKIFSTKTVNKVIIYTAAAMIFAASLALPVSAAETAPPTDSVTVPADVPGSNTTSIDASSAQPPADSTTVTPGLPTDTITITPLPEPTPADQGAYEVTPMQSTVYAASQKGLNVRSGPSTNHGKLGTLKYGQEITVTGKTADNWYQIQYSGSIGYVDADFVSDTPPASNVQTPATQEPAVETPAPEAPVPDADTEPVPPASEPDAETDSEAQTEEDSSEEGGTVVVSNLIGTPVYIVLAIAIVGVLALIGCSVYSFFKKDSDSSDEYYEDEYYEDGEYPDDEYYEEYEQEPDNEYYEEFKQDSDEEYYEEYGQDSDDEYYEETEQDSNEEYDQSNGQYPDEEYDESNGQYPDDEYYENDGQYPDEAYYKNNGKRR